MYLADATVFLAVTMSLAVFDIRMPVVSGIEVQPNMEFTSGVIRCAAQTISMRTSRLPTNMISHPPPFECSIKPRSAKAEELILAGDARA